MNKIINSLLIQELRKRTNAGIVKCRQALIESGGDLELAVDILRKSGSDIVLKKSSRITSAGLIAIEIASNKQVGAMIEINCETDFVARNKFFQEFAKMVLVAALHESINHVDILQTRFEDQRNHLISIVGENVKINRFVLLKGDYLGSYVHGLKIGVIISVIGVSIVDEFVKYVAMHIAAKDSKYINVSDIPKNVILREQDVQMGIAVKTGKPVNILKKIVEGRMKKFINESVLTRQNFIMDENETVGDVLSQQGIKVKDFVRFEVGNEFS